MFDAMPLDPETARAEYRELEARCERLRVAAASLEAVSLTLDLSNQAGVDLAQTVNHLREMIGVGLNALQPGDLDPPAEETV